MNILFTICGRAGSKGVKNKNLKDFLGYPLPCYTVSAIDLFIKKFPNVKSDIVLNTDSNDLIKLFRNSINLNIDVIEREAVLGLDATPKLAVILNCLKVMEERKSVHYDMVIDLDITSPLRKLSDLIGLIERMKKTNADVVFSITNSRRNPYFNMVKKTMTGYQRVIDSKFNSRQETPEVFDMNASLYAYSPLFLKKEKGLFEGKCDAIKMADTAILDIDDENDYELMQVVAKYLFNKDLEFNRIRDNIKVFYKE